MFFLSSWQSAGITLQSVYFTLIIKTLGFQIHIFNYVCLRIAFCEKVIYFVYKFIITKINSFNANFILCWRTCTHKISQKIKKYFILININYFSITRSLLFESNIKIRVCKNSQFFKICFIYTKNKSSIYECDIVDYYQRYLVKICSIFNMYSYICNSLHF